MRYKGGTTTDLEVLDGRRSPFLRRINPRPSPRAWIPLPGAALPPPGRRLTAIIVSRLRVSKKPVLAANGRGAAWSRAAPQPGASSSQIAANLLLWLGWSRVLIGGHPSRGVARINEVAPIVPTPEKPAHDGRRIPFVGC